MRPRYRIRTMAITGHLAIAAMVATMAAGCSSSDGNATTPAGPPPTSASSVIQPVSPSPSSPPDRPASAPASGPRLSGSWTGRYGGGYSGTFQLTWQQVGPALRGTITLSDPASTESITGTVAGSSIHFGTVGSTAITYRGDISGSSMAGSYQVRGADAGTWTAHKS